MYGEKLGIPFTGTADTRLKEGQYLVRPVPVVQVVLVVEPCRKPVRVKGLWDGLKTARARVRGQNHTHIIYIYTVYSRALGEGRGGFYNAK